MSISALTAIVVILFLYILYKDVKVKKYLTKIGFNRWPGIINLIDPFTDASALKEVTHSRAQYPKPIENFDVFSETFFGKNILTTEGEEWKRHRRISAPVFSEKNNRLVWNTTVNIMQELFDEVWKDQPQTSVDHFLTITTRIALMVLSNAGFGTPMTWQEDTTIPPGHSMMFADALSTVCKHLLFKIAIPSWALGLTNGTRKIRTAFEEINLYMTEMIAERRRMADKEDQWDLLTNLVRAGEDSFADDTKLTYTEITGNIFVYLIAGHETTAHTLCYVFGLLALYPEEQEKLYQHIKSIIGDRQPTYEDYPSLNRVLACFYETLRLYPVVNGIAKRAAEDSVLTTTSADFSSSATTAVAIPKGALLIFNIVALHHNPRYWSDPNDFKPERFLKNWNRDAFVPFSNGPRACIGRRFSETEAVAVITLIISRYRVTVKEEPRYVQGTIYQRRDSLLASFHQLTLTPKRMPLAFIRR